MGCASSTPVGGGRCVPEPSPRRKSRRQQNKVEHAAELAKMVEGCKRQEENAVQNAAMKRSGIQKVPNNVSKNGSHPRSAMEARERAE